MTQLLREQVTGARLRLLRDPQRRRALVVGGLLGVWLSAALLVWEEVLLWPQRAPFSLGSDSWAYWSAWSQGLYGHDPGDHLGRYVYSPAFAQLIYPLTRLPWTVFAASWSLALLGAYAWLLRPLPWRWRVPAFLLLGLDDVLLGNIHAFLAVALVLALRVSGVWGFVLITKPPLAIGLLAHVRRRGWSRLGVVALWVGGRAGLSLALAPELWVRWWHLLRALEPVTGERWYLVRLAAGVGLALLASRPGRLRVLPLALVLAAPMVDPASMGLLAAVPRLPLSPDGARPGS